MVAVVVVVVISLIVVLKVFFSFFFFLSSQVSSVHFAGAADAVSTAEPSAVTKVFVAVSVEVAGSSVRALQSS